MSVSELSSILLAILGITGGLITILNFFNNRKKDNTQSDESIRKKAYEEGKRDSEILNSIKQLTEKVDDVIRKQVTREEFAKLEARCLSNSHRIDKLEGASNE